MNKISKTACFTGHRNQKLPWRFNEEDERCKIMKKNLKLEIERAIAKGYTTFLCGMALGFDMICAETVLAFNNYLCTDCNHVEFCDVEEQKSLMGDAFAEIDKQELSDALTHVMSKIKEQVKFKA